MTTEIELVLPPQQVANHELILQKLVQQLEIQPHRIKHVHYLKRSVDARSRNVVYRLKIKVYIDEEPLPEIFSVKYPNVSDKRPVFIIGAGPAGLFAALQCIRIGLKPVIFDRGKDVKLRRRDLAMINKQGMINPESNYCFGEGGAGTYSDGKLYTRSNKRGDVQQVLNTFVAHGATEDILIDARPHIGTNKLPQIITSIRQTILDAGGEVYFNSQLTRIIMECGAVKGIELADGTKLDTGALILATGHSARDVYYLLYEQKIGLEAKPFALGVRIEHPQQLIDEAQYHSAVRSPYLPPSYYSLVEQVDGRGVFSFCMCPGGIIAPCATNAGEIVVNGWSPSKRNNPFANSGMVVQVNTEDVAANGSEQVLKMLQLQARAEQLAFNAGGGNLVAPAQRMVDFVDGRLSATLPQNSYLPGCNSTCLKEVLPENVYLRLKKTLPVFGKKMAGFYTNEAILVGVESRTSSAIRIPRDKHTLQHPQVKGLFPCGEGAGYAGGIVSAAIDGINCANALLNI